MVRLQRVTFTALHNYLGLSSELINKVRTGQAVNGLFWGIDTHVATPLVRSCFLARHVYICDFLKTSHINLPYILKAATVAYYILKTK